ncbi:MAG: tetratricopeptide repeat protein [Gammaproteobacteria bacterium]|nr:tetratricopeptide repeat protein [Gammaproteobacteria bacterium]
MRIAAYLAIATYFVTAAPAFAVGESSSSDAFAAGAAAFSSEEFDTALTHFLAARELGLDGPAIHYNLGVCHYKLGDWRSARAEFEAIAERFPEMRALAQYNLGLVAQKEQRDAEAQSLFRQAFENSEDETIRALARRQLELAPPEEPREWLTLVDARLGHDDNVLLLSEDIPLPDGQSAESRFTELWGLVSGPLSSDGGFRFDGSVYAVRYADASIFDQSVLRAAAAYEWDWGSWGAEAGPYISYTTLDGDAFEQRIGVGVRLERSLSAQTTLGVRVLHDEIDEGEARFAAFGGSRNWLELRVDQDMADGRLTLSYAREDNDRRGSHVSADRDRLSVRYRHYFDSRWLADVQAAWRDSRYGDILDARDENLTELSLGVTRNLPQAWQIGGELSIGSNDSNVETFAYDRSRMALGFTKQF